MRIRRALAATGVAIILAGTLVAGVVIPGHKSVEGPVQFNGFLCSFQIHDANCPEDSEGWAGSSEDNRVIR